MEVCTACFVASCREHAHLHYTKFAHQFSITMRLVEVERNEVSQFFPTFEQTVIKMRSLGRHRL
jgi:hypothetical protein